MKNDVQFVYDPEKNLLLKKQRGINFEDVITAIEQGHLLDVKPHHNSEKYTQQDILVVEINDYVYLIPCIQQGNELVLKTVYPSRKATASYLEKGEK